MKNRINSSEVSLFSQGSPTFYTSLNDGERLKYVPLVQDVSFVFNYGQNNVKVKSMGSSEYAVRHNMLSPEPEINFTTYADPRLLMETGLFGMPNYVVANGENMVLGSPTSQVLSNLDSIFNLYFIINKEQGFDFLGVSSIGDTEVANLSGYTSVGFGDCQITSYELNLSASDISTVSVSARASQVLVESLNTGYITLPSIDFTGGNRNDVSSGKIDGLSFVGRTGVEVVGGGGISPTVTIDSEFPIVPHSLTGDICIQNAQISLNLNRSSRYGFGNKFIYGRDLSYPIDGSVNIEVLATDLTTGLFSDMVDPPIGTYRYGDVSLTFKLSSEEAQTGTIAISNCLIEDISYSHNINDELTASIALSFFVPDNG